MTLPVKAAGAKKRGPDDCPCEAERATKAKAIAAYVALAGPLEALVTQRARGRLVS